MKANIGRIIAYLKTLRPLWLYLNVTLLHYSLLYITHRWEEYYFVASTKSKALPLFFPAASVFQLAPPAASLRFRAWRDKTSNFRSIESIVACSAFTSSDIFSLISTSKRWNFRN